MFDRPNLRFGPLIRGYFSVNDDDLSTFNLASFQGGAFAERDLYWGDRVMIGRTDYVYVLDLLDNNRFGD